MRKNGRKADELRDITISKNYVMHPEGSVLVAFGNTKVICNATVENNVPRFLKGKNMGWVTAEYGMLPRSTNERMRREAKIKQSGRTMEIQRLIGRSLRSSVNLDKLGERSITIDCDVIQADGGTRTASITGGCVAMSIALNGLVSGGKLKESPLKQKVAAISVGIYEGKAVLDLDYPEDSSAETDMNVVMTDKGGFIEVQGTAEGEAFEQDEFDAMLALARKGLGEIFALQQATLSQ